MPVGPASLIPLGFAIARVGAKIWLADDALAKETSLELAGMLERKIRDPFQRNKAKREFERMAEDIAERLAPYFASEFKGLPDNEIAAAGATLEHVLDRLSIDDRALFDADLNPVELERYIRSRCPDASVQALLSPAGVQLYDFALREACNYIVEIAVSLPPFGARATAELLKRETELASLVRTALDHLPQQDADTDHDPSGRFEREYARELARKLDRLELFGLDSETVPRRFALSVAYITLSTSLVDGDTDKESRVEQTGDQSEDTQQGAVSAVDAALATSRRTVVRGEAGSGKTTLLQWLAVSAARRAFTGPLEAWNDSVALFLRLRTFARSPLPSPEDLPGAIAPALAGDMPPGWVHEQLRSGRALVLVDGVDELPETRREDVHEWLLELTSSFPDARYIVTSRPPALEEGWLDDLEFQVTELQPMNARDIQSFVDHWHKAASEVTADADKWEHSAAEGLAMMRLIREQSALRALATTPLLCAMLCALHKSRRTQLPRDRIQLYRIALEMLLERRDIERSIENGAGLSLTLREKELLLQAFAYSLAVNGASDESRAGVVDIVAHQLESMPHVKATASTVFQHLLTRSGLIREPIPDRVDFIHRTFQEYLAAREALDHNHIQLLVREATSDQWRQTIVLAAGLAQADQRERLIGGLIERGDAEEENRHTIHLLAAACLETSPQLPPSLADALRDRIRRLVPPRNMTEARELASAGDLAAPLLHRDPKWYATSTAAAVRTLALMGGDTALSILRDYGTDRRLTVSRELLRAWPSFDVVTFAREVLSDSILDKGRVVIDDIALLDGLAELRHLTSIKCDLYGDFTNQIFDGITVPIDLTLTAWPEYDLELLRGTKSLTSLVIPGASELRDISALAGNNALKYVSITRTESLTDVAALSECPSLEWVVLDATQIRSLSALTPSTQLRRLECSWATELSDLGGLTELVGINWLDIRGCPSIADFQPISHLQNLHTLFINDCAHLISLSALRGLSKLAFVNCGENPALTSLAGLESPALQRLAAGHCDRLESLDGLGDLPNLADADFRNNSSLVDISELSRMPNVRQLDLSATNVADTGPLAAHGRSLTRLNLNGTRTRDLNFAKSVRSLRQLRVQNCPDLDDITGIASHPSLEEVWIDGGKSTDWETLASLKSLQVLVVAIHDPAEPIMRAGLELVAEALPDVRIRRRRTRT